MASLEDRVADIESRNKSVEADKAWETSIFRVVLISLLTYLVTSYVFYVLDVDNYYFNAIIPTIGYFLSTQSLPFVKKWWVKKRYY